MSLLLRTSSRYSASVLARSSISAASFSLRHASSSSSSSAVAPSSSSHHAPAQPLSRFSGAFTTSGNPNVTPYHAPVSHAPVEFSKLKAGEEGMDRYEQKSAQEYIDAVPVIEVDGPTAVCDGGDPRLGHPIEFIQLNKVNPEKPSTCKYCGLRFVQKPHHH